MAWTEIEQWYIEEEGHLKWIHWTCSGYSHLINCKAQIKTETCNSKIESGVGIRTLKSRGDKSYNYNNTFPNTAFHIKLKLVLTSDHHLGNVSWQKVHLVLRKACSYLSWHCNAHRLEQITVIFHHTTYPSVRHNCYLHFSFAQGS